MVYSDAAQAALLTWVNTFPLDKNVKSLADLSDGKVLCSVMADIDPSFDRRRPRNTSDLQAVIKGLRHFITVECVDLDALVETADFKAISSDGRVNDLLELLTFVLVAATSGPKRESYVTTIQSLEENQQAELAGILRQRMSEAEKSQYSRYQPPNSPGTDTELQLEFRFATLMVQKRAIEQENDRLLKQAADMTTRLIRLQENNDSLQMTLAETEDKLNLPIRDDETAHFIKRLEDKIREQDDLIESQEGQFEQDRQEKEKMRRELASLRDAASRLIRLEDEVKELKFKNIELAKKANTVDRFKQKLEAQKSLEADLKNLGLENEELRAQHQDYSLLKQRNESLEVTQTRFQNSIAKAEMEIFEIGSQKKLLDEEKASLERAVESLEERRQHDEQFILELQEQLLMKSTPIGESLEDQLQSVDSTDRHNNLELSRLKAENVLLKGNAFAAHENSTLRAQLEEAEAYRKVIEAKYREAFEKDIISQQQLRAMISSAEDNVKTQAFIDLKTAHSTAVDQLSSLKKKYSALESEYEETKRNLLSATSDLSMIEKDDIDALEELKATQESLSKSFENELTALKGKYKALDIDYDLQKSQLIESLLANNKLREAVEEKSHVVEGTSPDKTISEETPIEKTSSQPDDGEAQKKDALIAELQAHIKELEESGNDAQKAALERENENLKREYGMMTMAWYDLSSRVQSNTVMLQRRSEVSKSWINKQRRAVNPTGRR